MTKENRYKELRKSLEWSREAAAEALGMSDDKLERIDNGEIDKEEYEKCMGRENL